MHFGCIFWVGTCIGAASMPMDINVSFGVQFETKPFLTYRHGAVVFSSCLFVDAHMLHLFVSQCGLCHAASRLADMLISLSGFRTARLVGFLCVGKEGRGEENRGGQKVGGRGPWLKSNGEESP